MDNLYTVFEGEKLIIRSMSHVPIYYCKRDRAKGWGGERKKQMTVAVREVTFYP